MRGALRLFHFLSYLGFRFGEGLIRLLPLEGAFVVGGAGGTGKSPSRLWQ
jgi:hypothetical protein